MSERKDSPEKATDFNLPQIPPPLSLLNAVSSNHGKELSAFSISHHLHEDNHVGGMKHLAEETKANFAHEGIDLMKTEQPYQQLLVANPGHNVSMKNLHDTNVEKLGPGKAGPRSVAVESPLSNGYATPISQSICTQILNSGLHGNRTQNLTSLHNHCVPNAFKFNVSNLIHRNCSK